VKQELLRREPHFRHRGADFRRDVVFELGEVLLEHLDQRARGLVELFLVFPGLESLGIENYTDTTEQLQLVVAQVRGKNSSNPRLKEGRAAMLDSAPPKWLAEMRSFTGKLSLDGNSLNLEFRSGLDPSGEFVFEFDPIPLNNGSKFIDLEWDRDKVRFTHFSLAGVASDTTHFETSDLIFTTLGWRTDASGTRMTPQAQCSKAVLTYSLKEPAEKPALRMQLKGLKSYGIHHAACALGEVHMGGQHEIQDANTVTGSIAVQADDLPANVASWQEEADRLLEHMRRVMSFASSSMIRGPITEFFNGETVTVTVQSQSKTSISAYPIFHFLDHEPIFQAAVRSFFEQPIAARHLFFAIEWFAMDAGYNEVRLVAAMTALENLINSNLDEADGLILPKRTFEKTRRVLRNVIRTCIAKWPADNDEVTGELNEKLTELNRRSFLRKLKRLALRWNVPLDGITDEMLQAAKQARDRVLHRGQYYEDAADDDASLWTHVTVVREVAARFLLAAIGFQGRYHSYIGGYHDVQFPPQPPPA
jgi:hypothetical protein